MKVFTQVLSVLFLTVVFSLFALAQFLPAEMSYADAQQINGAGTCTCCNFGACVKLASECGTNSYATSGTANAGDCNCDMGTTNPCESYYKCNDKKSGTGNECNTGNC